MSTIMHKSTPSKIVPHLKNNRCTANDSTYKSNQNAPIKQSISPTSKIAVIDIERENRLSKVISLYSKGLNQEEICTRTTCRSIYSKQRFTIYQTRSKNQSRKVSER